MEKINLEEILEDYCNIITTLDSKKEIHSSVYYVKKAIKEACRQVLELAADNAKAEIHTEWEGNTGSEYYTDYAVVNKQSILDTINQVE